MRMLVLDAATGTALAAVVADGEVVAIRTEAASVVDGRSPVGGLAVMADDVMRDAPPIDAVAVTVGPGSFTGIRGALSLAAGIGLGAGVPVVGVTIGEALAADPSLAPALATGRHLWAATDSRRGRTFVERKDDAGEDDAAAFERASLPTPDAPIVIAGDAAIEVASVLAARGADIMLSDLRRPTARGIAAAAAARLDGILPPREAIPLYVDPPEARPAA